MAMAMFGMEMSVRNVVCWRDQVRYEHLQQTKETLKSTKGQFLREIRNEKDKFRQYIQGARSLDGADEIGEYEIFPGLLLLVKEDSPQRVQ
jgi:hypothetical protein